MADNIKYRFIQNVGDYFPSGYFGEDFLEKVRKCADVSTDEMKALCSPYAQLQRDYNEFKNFIINQNPRVKDAIKKTHDFHTRLLRILGYETDNAYTEPFVVNAEAEPIEMIPVRHILRRGSQVKMLIMEMQHLIPDSLNSNMSRSRIEIPEYSVITPVNGNLYLNLTAISIRFLLLLSIKLLRNCF